MENLKDQELLDNEAVEERNIDLDEPAFADISEEDSDEVVETQEEVSDNTTEATEDNSDVEPKSEEMQEEETTEEELEGYIENLNEELDNKQPYNSEFHLNLHINLNNGPIEVRDGVAIATKILAENTGYRGRITLRYKGSFDSKTTGDTVHVVSKPQFSFGRQFGISFPSTFMLVSEELKNLEIGENDIIVVDATISESDNVNKKTGKPYITLTDIENARIVRRA